MENVVLAADGRQYRVKTGDTIVMELQNAAEGESCVFEQVLMLEQEGSVRVGTPFLTDVSVRATVMENFRDDKVRIFKMRRRKKSRRTHGHRQHLARVRIDAIETK